MKKLFFTLALIALCAGRSSAFIVNGGFEFGALFPWVGYGAVNTVRSGNFFGIEPAEGNYYIAVVSSYGVQDGGVYQQVTVPAGSWTFTAKGQSFNSDQFVYLAGQASTFPDVYVQLGVDITGGTDFAAAPIKSAAVNTGAKWETLSVDFTIPAATTVTLFMNMDQVFAFAGNWTAFDDAAIVPEPASLMVLGLGVAGLFARSRRK